ncbi:uncharacterized protein LOC122502763 [Leptopilina heterotoma]|uniref:uncharacterized protein LOC122502763 n=1 Tax=Leptopilina heterotoma TaxID=63436 RepID=UPI001CA9314B|nr:uncharacterized protein LOC122502763 [Leptopilina heterotoma]
MKRERDTNIVENLIEHLEEILQKAKVNELRHFIEPLETTIVRVKNLKETIKVKCDSTDDFQMACSCNDWGNDILTPSGKWICECGENCSCSKTWTSCVNIPSEKIPPQELLLEKKGEKLSEKNEEINLEPNKTVSILYNRADKKEECVTNFEINTAHNVNYPSKSIDSDDNNNNNFKLKESTKLKCENCKCSTDDKGKLMKTEECAKSSKQERRKKDIQKSPKEEKFINVAETSTRKILEPWKSREDEMCREEAMKETFQQQINCDKPEKPLKCSEMAPKNLFKNREEICEGNKKQQVEKSTITVKLEEKISKTGKLCQCSAPMKIVPTEKDVSFGKRIPKTIKKSKEKIIEGNFCKEEKITTACNECSLPSKEITNSEKIDCQCSPDWMKKLKQNCTTQGKNSCCSEYQEGIIIDSRDGNVKRSDREINVNRNASLEEAHCSSNLFSPATSAEKLCSCGCGYFIEGVPDISTISCNNTSKSPRQKMSTSKNKTLKLQENDCACGGKCE